jgi:hypothetical protein
MCRRILILAALAAAAAALSWVNIASGQASPPAPGAQAALQPPSTMGQTAAPQTLSRPSAAHSYLPPSPSGPGGRQGSVSYRYDALGRIVEIVRIPAR